MSFTNMNWLAYDTFEPGINGQIEYEASIYSLFDKSSKGIDGRTTKIKLQTGDGAVGNISEGGDYVVPVDPAGSEASLTLSQVTAAIGFTTYEWALLNGASAGAQEIVAFKMQNIKDALKRDIVRQSWGDGSGTLARATAGTNVNVIPISSTTTNQYDRDRGIWLAPGRMQIDLVDSVTGTAIANGTNRTISAVDFTSGASTVTVTGTANLTPTATTVLVRTGNVAGGGTYTSREWPGLQSIINSTNTYLGINRSTGSNAFWRATNLTNSGTIRALTLPLIYQLRSEVAKQGMMVAAPDYCYLANQGIFQAYGDLLTPQMRFAQSPDTTRMLDAGWAALEIFGTPLMMDIHCPRYNLFAVYKPGVAYRYAKHARTPNPFQFIDYDGGPWRMQPSTTTQGSIASVVLGHMEGFLTMVSPRPNLMGRLNDLSEVGTVN